MLNLISQALFIISDSGGIQEEATCFNKKIIVVRKKTERPETIEIGLGHLAGENIQNFIKWAKILPSPIINSPYGDGNTAKKIIRVLSKYFS